MTPSRFLSVPVRRVIAFAIDLFIVQFLAQALLNAVGWPMPGWICPLVLPGVFVAYTLALAARGAEARTLGKRLLGLAIRTTDGQRPGFASLLVRSAAFAIMLLMDWSGLVTSTAGNATAFGIGLIFSIAVGVVVLSYGVLRQLQTGISTPYDAIALTCVVRSAAPRAEAPVVAGTRIMPAVVAVIAVAALFMVNLVTGWQDCPPCREAEAVIADRFGTLSRVSIEASQQSSTPAASVTRVDARVWMPVVAAPRPQRDSILSVAAEAAVVYLRQRAMRVDQFTVTQQLTQVPFELRAIHPLLPPAEPTLRLVIGPGDQIGPLHLGFGMEFTYSTRPYEGPGK